MQRACTMVYNKMKVQISTDFGVCVCVCVVASGSGSRPGCGSGREQSSGHDKGAQSGDFQPRYEAPELAGSGYPKFQFSPETYIKLQRLGSFRRDSKQGSANFDNTSGVKPCK